MELGFVIMIKGKKLYLPEGKFSPDQLTKEDLNKIRKIYLEKTRAKSLSPSHLQVISLSVQVQVLHLNDNLIEALPNDLELLVNLKKLYLQNNKLAQLTVANAIFKLPYLGIYLSFEFH